MKNKRTKRTYTEEFKAAALQDLAAAGESVAKVAKRHGIHETLLRNWLKRAHEMQANGEPSGAQPDRWTGPAGRTVYSQDFKRRVVARVQAGEAIPTIAREIEVGDAMIRRWAKTVETGAPDRHGYGKANSGHPKPQVNASPPLGDGAWSNVMDAFLYLRNAEKELERMQRTGEVRKLDDAHLLMMLALRALSKATGKK